MVKPTDHTIIPCIFPIGEECMVSFLAADRIEKQLTRFYPRQELTYVFEFRVESGKDQVDLAMAFAEKDDLLFLKDQYAQKNNQSKVANWLDNCIQLLSKDQAVKSFWVESDLDGIRDDHIPSLFISPKKEINSPQETQHFFEVLNFSQQDKRSNDLLKECVNALQDGQYIEHLGVMHSRGNTKTTRLYIRGFNVSSLFVFLDRIQWPGDKELLVKQFDDMTMVSYISIAIEFNDNWLPSIGIEFHLKEGVEHSEKFLSQLKDKGFCSSKRVESIIDILQPQKIKSAKASFRRKLSHFKINIGKDGVVEPKVYVQLIPDYLSVFGF